MHAEYLISKLSDFLAVPEDRLTDCLIDFHIWLQMARSNGHVDHFTILAAVAPGTITFNREQFVWIDDGKNCISAVEFSADGHEVVRMPVGEQ